MWSAQNAVAMTLAGLPASISVSLAPMTAMGAQLISRSWKVPSIIDLVAVADGRHTADGKARKSA